MCGAQPTGQTVPAEETGQSPSGEMEGPGDQGERCEGKAVRERAEEGWECVSTRSPSGKTGSVFQSTSSLQRCLR